MASPNLNLNISKPEIPQGQDVTHDNPVTAKPADEASGKKPRLTLPEGITEEDLQEVLALIRTLKQSWVPQRMAILQKVLEGYQFFKGDHFFGFYPGSFQMFNAFDQFNSWSGAQVDGGKAAEDTSLLRFATNFQQMLGFGFISALSADVPRNESAPKNAEEQEDRETAKASQTVQTIIAKANGAKTLHRMKLFQFWTSGCYFEHTRYVVDGDRFDTHEEKVATATKTQVLPDRYICPQCRKATPLASLKGKDLATCPNCKAPLSEQFFFQGTPPTEIPVFEAKTDVPNGMVLQDIYGPLNVDVKPNARALRHTPLLDLQVEVALGWLRDAFPAFYEDLQPGMGASDSQSTYDRQARQAPLTGTSTGTPAGGAYNVNLQTDPTYSQTWLQPWAFSYLDKKELGAKLKKAFPKGCMMAHCGDLVLQVRQAQISKEWTWAGTVKGDYGLFPPPVGEAGIPLNKRYNNLAALIDDYMERCALGLTLVNQYYLDTKKMNRLRILPGQLNPIALKNGQNIQDISKILHQFTFQLEAKIFEYASSLKFDMQMLVGVPPQVLGGDPGENVKTASGQSQQLGTAKGKLALFWDQIAEQEAEASEQGVYCAAENMTDPWWDTVTDRTKQYRNEWVHPDQMQGAVRVTHDATQGLPMSPDELRAFWEKILDSSNKIIAAMLFKEPKNLDAAIRSFGVPGVVAPGQLTEAKTLWYIDKLMKSGPKVETIMGPNGPQQIDVPSVQPDRFRDDLPAMQQIIRDWGDEHFDKLEANPNGDRNVLAFFKLCVEHDIQNKQAMAAASAPPPGAMPPPGAQHSAPPQAAQ